MKTKILAWLLLFVMLLSCCPLWAAAEPADSAPDPAAASAEGNEFEALSFLDYPDCTTTIVDLDGVPHTFQGCLDAAALEETSCCEDIASYSVYLGGALLLEVQLHEIQAEDSVSLQGLLSNGYYSIQFDLDRIQEVFLTGLTPENLRTIQQEILSARLAGQDVSFENIDFIDAEKALHLLNLDNAPDTDKNLCWAAAVSNVLHYTGWGKLAGFGSADYLLDVFTTRFSDDESNESCALSWFFNGFYPKQGLEDFAQIDDKTYGSFQGYLPEYPVETVMDCLSLLNNRERLSEITASLKDEYGVCLSVGLYGDDIEDRKAGHAITLWGYAKKKSDSNGYTYLIISDSDDDKYDRGGDRRSAPNKLCALGLSVCTRWDMDSWAFSDYDGGGNAIIDGATRLAPYSEALPTETEGTLNRFARPDLAIDQLGVNTGFGSDLYSRTVLPAGQDLFVQFTVYNNSAKAVESFPFRIQVEKDGVSKVSGNLSFDYPLEGGWDGWYSYPIGPLEAGRYTLTITFNPLHSVKEANYLNNAKTISFTVSASDSIGTLRVALGNMGKQDDGRIGAIASITRPCDGTGYFVYTAYGDDKIETDWNLQYQGAAFPSKLFTARDVYYSNVFYRMVVKTGDASQPWREFRSGAVAQKYRYIRPFAGDSNVYSLTSRPQGSAYYFSSEKTSFNYINWSTVSESFPFYYCLRAYRQDGDYWYRLGNVFGEDSLEQFYYYTNDKTNTRLFTNDNQYLPPDRYYIYAEAEYKDLLGKDEISSTYLGTIVITPTGTVPQVITETAVFADQFGAAFPVSALVNLGMKVRLGIEYSTDRSFANATRFWFTEDCIDYDCMNIFDYDWISDLFPGTTYYYRAILQKSGSSTIYRGDEIKSMTTSSGATDLIYLNSPQKVSLDSDADMGNNSHNYIFEPSATGWYHFSVSGGDCMLISFGKGSTKWNADFADKGKVETNYYLTAGRQYCLHLVSFETTAYTVTVSRSDTSVSSYLVNNPTLKEAGDLSFLAEVSASVPLGSSFTLGLEYGLTDDNLTVVSEDFTDWHQDSAEAALKLDFLPGQTYMYRAFVRDANTGTKVYSAVQTAEVSSFTGVLLPEGEQTLTLERNETRDFYSFTAETAGTYTFRIDGPDGVFTYWDEGWIDHQFTLTGYTVTVPLAAGETAYFTVKGYSPGEYHLSYAFTGDSRTCGKNGFGRSFAAAQDGLCFATTYDANGKMLTVQQVTMTAGQRCTVYTPYQTGMAYMKVFQTSGSLAPVCPPVEIK